MRLITLPIILLGLYQPATCQTDSVMAFALEPIHVSGYRDSAHQIPISESVLSISGRFVWGGSVVRGEDGRFHMFFSSFDAGPANPPFSDAWLLSSVIAHAVSDYPDRGFRYDRVVLPGAASAGDPGAWDARGTHNPHIKKFNGRYFLYYIGSRDPGERPYGNPGHGLSARNRIQQVQFPAVIGVETIGELVDGRFVRPKEPLLKARTRVKPVPVIDPSPKGTLPLPDNLILVNPTVEWNPGSGKFMMYFKGNQYTPNWKGVHGVASSNHPDGPFIPSDSVMFEMRGADGSLASAEDPYVWYHPATRYFYAVFKDFQGIFTGAEPSLAIMISRDGIHWKMHPQRMFAPRELPLDDGSAIRLANMERPQFLIDEKGEPVAFYAACSIAPCGPKTDGSTFNAQFAVRIRYIND